MALRQPSFGSEPYPAAGRADAARLEQHLRFLSAPGEWRSLHNGPGMSRAADYITKAFGATGASLSEQRYKAGPVETRNVIARFGLEARPRVVVGAHYDVYGDFPDQSAGPSPRTLGASGQVEFLGVDAPAVLRPLHGRPSSWKRVAVTADNFEPLPVDPLIARAGIAFRFGTP